jgi:phage/plasmid-associated DNA primase
MEDPTYLAKLNGQVNIGVLLGDGLCTIDIDDNKYVKPFFSLNPKLRKTLRTCRRRGCNLWIRIKENYPPACKLKTKDGKNWGEWRADGNQTLIHGKAIGKGERKATGYTVQVARPPVVMAFHEIKWPDDLVLPWLNEPEQSDLISANLEELRRRYGEPFYCGKKGNLTSLNQGFWAGLLASENHMLWEPDEREFYTYNSTRGIYEEESADAIKHQLSKRLLQASRQTNCFWLQTQRTNRGLNDITAHLRGIVERRGAFKHEEPRIHLANGIFRFTNGGELIQFSPEIISRNASPILFDENAPCPRFLNELVLPAMSEENVLLMQKYFGQCLLGRNLIQRILILDGFTRRGKTQLANVIQAVIGRLNCTHLRTHLLDERFETYRYLKKTLLVGVDVAPDFLSTPGAAVLKGLVGGDWFDAEQKCGTGSFQFQGVFNVIVTSNTRLRVRLCGDIGAWRRRLLIIRYERPKPPKEISDFADLLVREEGSGILNFAIAGLAMLLEDIDKGNNIAMSDRQRTVVDNLLAESDSVRIFLREAVEPAEEWDLSVSEIVERYAAFCPERGWNPLPITEVQRSLEGLMLELFHMTKSHCIKRDGRSVRGFFGVRFK